MPDPKAHESSPLRWRGRYGSRVWAITTPTAVASNEAHRTLLAGHPLSSGKSGIDRGGGLKITRESRAAPIAAETASPGSDRPVKRNWAAEIGVRSVRRHPLHGQRVQVDQGGPRGGGHRQTVGQQHPADESDGGEQPGGGEAGPPPDQHADQWPPVGGHQAASE